MIFMDIRRLYRTNAPFRRYQQQADKPQLFVEIRSKPLIDRQISPAQVSSATVPLS